MRDNVKTERYTNIELLRIIAMVFVVILHYLAKGGTLVLWEDSAFILNTGFAWFMEAFSLVAVNVYVLISGYFLADSPFRLKKIVKMWLQIYFYSAGIGSLFLLFGEIPPEADLGMFFFPVIYKHYWFASVYIVLYFLAPFLGVAVRKLSRTQLRTAIIVVMFFRSDIFNWLLPEWENDKGYGIAWFICLFMIAAYVRYYVPLDGNWKKPLLVYIISSSLLFLSIPGFTILSRLMENAPSCHVFFDYNDIFTITGAIALFLAFRNMKIKSDKVSLAINKVAKLTFGVYLLHEHVLFRPLWCEFWKVDSYYRTPYFGLHFLIVVSFVFVVGCIVEFIRQLLFHKLGQSVFVKKIERKIAGIDKFFNGDELSR